MSPLAILVVEDDAPFRDCIAAILARTPHLVTMAGDVPAAIKLIERRPFDVVLTDMLLGEHDGTEIITAVRRRNRNTRVVAMSGGGAHLTPSYMLNLAVSFGALVPLMKPFTADQLVNAIEPEEWREALASGRPTFE